MKKIITNLQKILIRIATGFIPSSKLRKKFRASFFKQNAFKNNEVYLIDKNGNKKRVFHEIRGLNLVMNGKNNIVEMYKNSRFRNSLAMFIGDNSILKIGNNFSSVGVNFWLGDEGSNITIGDDCMFSQNINIWAADGHTIINKDDDIPCNYPKPVILGNHIWVGAGVTITKGAVIPDDSIIGACALVCSKFNEKNIVIAGNPAKIIKKNINWDGRTIVKYSEHKSLGLK